MQIRHAVLAALAVSFAGPRPALPQQKSAAPVSATTTALARLSDDLQSLVERARPAVAQIMVSGYATPGEGGTLLARQRGGGSGVVVDPDGYVITNLHVVEGARRIEVILPPAVNPPGGGKSVLKGTGRAMGAVVVGVDQETDLAVLLVPQKGLPFLQLGDSETLKPGEFVVALGSPMGLEGSVTVGVVSAQARQLEPESPMIYMQTDASINPGNSGGPLCDLEGRVVGINTMIVGRGSGIGFAVPSNLVRRAAEQILKTGKVERAWIGVGAQDLTPELAAALKVDPRAGALVNSVTETGPARRAQVKPGDIIASVAGKPVHDAHDLTREIIAHDVGQQLQLEVVRDGKHYGTQVQLAARPEQPIPPVPVQQQGVPQPGLGLSVRDLPPQQAAQLGLPSKSLPLITQVSPGSAADRAGLKPGDVIVEVDGIADPNAAQVQQAASDGQLLVRVRRRDASFYAALKK